MPTNDERRSGSGNTPGLPPSGRHRATAISYERAPKRTGNSAASSVNVAKGKTKKDQANQKDQNAKVGGGGHRRSSGDSVASQLGQRIKAGSAATVIYTGKAVNAVNSLANMDQVPESKSGGMKRVTSYFKKMTLPAFMLFCAMVLVISAMAFSNGTIVVDRQKISIVGLPKELEGYTILQLSDLHAREFGSKQQVLLRTINEENYNLVLFTGDMVGSSGNAQPFYDLIEGLKARPKYFIPGDSDPAPLLSAPRDITGTLEQMVLNDWALGAQERGAVMLAHTTAIEVNNQTLWLSTTSDLNVNITETAKQLDAQVKTEKAGTVAGVAIDRTMLPLTSYRYNHMLLTQKASNAMKSTDMHIAMAHIPPTQEFMAVSQKLGQGTTVAYLPTVDLVLAGHYCGGVWRMPGIGAVYIPNSLYPRHGWFPNQGDVQGVKSVGLSTLYTSAGLGVTDQVWLPNFRLLNAPQVSLITLTAAITDNLLGE